MAIRSVDAQPPSPTIVMRDNSATMYLLGVRKSWHAQIFLELEPTIHDVCGRLFSQQIEITALTSRRECDDARHG
jgi:hypothetical protein